MEGSRRRFGLLGEGARTRAPRAGTSDGARTGVFGPALAPLAGIPYIDGAAVVLDPDDETPPAAIGEILAAIHLVTHGLAVRVSLSGFALPADLAREADEVARASGCRAIVAIGDGGRLGLVITGGEVKGG